MQVAIARPSVASLFLEPRFQSQGLGTSTGFVVERNGQRFLVTNWHVVSGRRPDTGAPLAPSGAVPDEIAILHNQAGALGSWILKMETLYDGAGSPRWQEHPAHRRQVDAVALPLNDLTDVEIYAYDPWSTEPAVASGVARPL